jgi:hypothetical protein
VVADDPKGVSVAQQAVRYVEETLEWVRPLPDPKDITVVTQIRGTLLVASRDQLRAVGRFSDYQRQLSGTVSKELDEVLPASWLPIQLAEEHYDAIDRLEMADAEIQSVTAAAARQIQGVLLTTMSKMARAGGLTVWSIVPLTGKVWERLFVGGALGVAREGPKDAVAVVAGHPLIRSRYHRLGFAQHLANAVRFVAGKQAYVRPRQMDALRGRAEFLVQWV